MKEAQQLFSQATQAALRNNFVEMSTDIEIRKAVFEADFGYPAKAREDALECSSCRIRKCDGTSVRSARTC